MQTRLFQDFCQKCWFTLRFRAHEVLLYRGKTFAERSGLRRRARDRCCRATTQRAFSFPRQEGLEQLFTCDLIRVAGSNFERVCLPLPRRIVRRGFLLGGFSFSGLYIATIHPERRCYSLLRYCPALGRRRRVSLRRLRSRPMWPRRLLLPTFALSRFHNLARLSSGSRLARTCCVLSKKAFASATRASATAPV